MPITNQVSDKKYKFKSGEEAVQDLYVYYKNILNCESFGYKLHPYYLDPHNVSLNCGPTSIIDCPAKKLTLSELINCT